MAQNTKYYKKLPEDFLNWMKEGESEVQVAARIGVAIGSLYRWAKDPRKLEFMKAWELGRQAAHAYWEARLQDVATGKKSGNAATIQYYMKVRFKGQWLEDGSNKHSIETTVKKYEDLSDNELNAVIQGLEIKPLTLVPRNGTDDTD